MGEDELKMDLFDLDLENIVADDIQSPIDDPDLNPPQPDGEGDKPDDDKINTEEPSEGDDPEIVATGAEGEASDDDSDDGEGDNTSPNAYKPLAKILFDEGVIPSADSSELEKVDSVEGLVELIQKQVTANEYSELNDIQKDYLNSLKEGLPTERFDAFKRAEDQISSITEDNIKENEQLRQQLIFREYKSRGYSDEKAAKLTQRSFEVGEDIEDAVIAHSTLKRTVEEAKEAELQKLKDDRVKAAKKIEEDRANLKKLIYDTDEVIKGYKITEGMKNQMYSKIMNPVSTNPESGKQENALMKFQREKPQEFMHKLYYLFTVTKDFEDFSYFTNKARTDSVKELEAAMKRSTHVSGGGDPSFIDDPDSFDSIIGDELIID